MAEVEPAPIPEDFPDYGDDDEEEVFQIIDGLDQEGMNQIMEEIDLEEIDQIMEEVDLAGIDQEEEEVERIMETITINEPEPDPDSEALIQLQQQVGHQLRQLSRYERALTTAESKNSTADDLNRYLMGSVDWVADSAKTRGWEGFNRSKEDPDYELLATIKPCCVKLERIEVPEEELQRAAAVAAAFVQVYTCEIKTCQRTFDNETTYLHHYQSHFKKFRCRYCERRFVSQKLFQSHMKYYGNHQTKKPGDKSDEPVASTSTAEDALQDENQHHQVRQPTGGRLKGAVLNTVNGQESGKKHWCDICKKKLASAGSMQKHMRIHTGEQPFVCHINGCGKGFTQKGNLDRHIKYIHKQEPFINRMLAAAVKQQKDKPETASKATASSASPKRQTSVSFAKKQTSPSPASKNKTSPAKKQARVSLAKKRTFGSYTKRHASISLPKNQTSLNKRRTSASPSPAKKQSVSKKQTSSSRSPDVLSGKKSISGFKCTVKGCTRTFLWKQNLRKHIRIHHGGEQSTSSCSSPSPTKAASDQLVRRSNNGFKCTVNGCTKKFLWLNNLKRHMKQSHKGAKKSKPASNFSSPSRTKANSDANVVGIDKKSTPTTAFQCPINGCECVFLYKKNLDTHLRRRHHITKLDNYSVNTIKAIPKFLCRVNGCQKNFMWKSTLKKHVKNHHQKGAKKSNKPIQIADYFVRNNRLVQGSPNKQNTINSPTQLSGKPRIDDINNNQVTINLGELEPEVSQSKTRRGVKQEAKEDETRYNLRQEPIQKPKQEPHDEEPPACSGYLPSSSLFSSKFRCLICQVSFSNAIRLRQHEATHSGDCPLVCDVAWCGIGFVRPRTFQLHKEIVHPEFVTCGDRVSTFLLNNFNHQQADLAESVNLVKEKLESDGNQSLSNGSQQLNNKKQVQRVQRGVKKQNQPAVNSTPILKTTLNKPANGLGRRIIKKPLKFSCRHPGCGARFQTYQGLNMHQVQHTNRYACRFCKKPCSSTNDRRRHERVHNDERPFPCPYPGCGKRFKAKKTMEDHRMAMHSTARPFGCQEPGCGKWFKTKHLLRSHRYFHEKVPRFVCPFDDCDKAFRDPSSLSSHKKKVHIGLRPWICPEDNCQKAFHDRQGLRRHLCMSHKLSKEQAFSLIPLTNPWDAKQRKMLSL